MASGDIQPADKRMILYGMKIRTVRLSGAWKKEPCEGSSEAGQPDLILPAWHGRHAEMPDGDPKLRTLTDQFTQETDLRIPVCHVDCHEHICLRRGHKAIPDQGGAGGRMFRAYFAYHHRIPFPVSASGTDR